MIIKKTYISDAITKSHRIKLNNIQLTNQRYSNLVKIEYYGFDMTSHGIHPKNKKGWQHIYLAHFISEFSNEISKETSIKVGRAKSLSARTGAYKQFLSNGNHDLCPVTKRLSYFNKQYPFINYKLVFEKLDFVKDHLAEEIEKMYTNRLIDEGYPLYQIKK